MSMFRLKKCKDRISTSQGCYEVLCNFVYGVMLLFSGGSGADYVGWLQILHYVYCMWI